MEQVEITKQQAEKIFMENGIMYELDDAFDTGFQNEFDRDGNPEETCVLDMTEDQARIYVIEKTTWYLELRDDSIYLIGNNDISGFGFAEEKIDYTKDVENIIRSGGDNLRAVYIDETEKNWK